MTATDQPAIDPALAEDLIALGERALRRSRPTEHARIEDAVVWLLTIIRRELRGRDV